jgi:hypothetical protein
MNNIYILLYYLVWNIEWLRQIFFVTHLNYDRISFRRYWRTDSTVICCERVYMAHFTYNSTRVEAEVLLKYTQGYFQLKHSALGAELVWVPVI